MTSGKHHSALSSYCASRLSRKRHSVLACKPDFAQAP